MYRIRCWIFGYDVVLFKGRTLHRFVNICRKHRIYLWDIHYSGNNPMFCIARRDYEEGCLHAAKCDAELEKIQEKGLPDFLVRHRSHRFFAVGMLMALMMVYAMSGYIWNIEVSGNYIYSDGVLTSYIDELGAGCGARKKNIVPSEIEEDLRIHYPGISWVSVQIIGTKLNVLLEEGTQGTDHEEKTLNEIQAQMDGTVLSIVTRKGTPLVHAGDTVKQGDVLIEGHVNVIGDDQTIVDVIETGADGDVIMGYEIPVSISIDKTYMKKMYTGRRSKGIVLDIWNHSFDIGQSEADYDQYDAVISKKQYRLTRYFYIPFTVKKTEYYEYIEEKNVSSDEEIRKMIQQRLGKLTQQCIDCGGSVMENKVNIRFDQNAGYAEGSLMIQIPADKDISEILQLAQSP